MSARQKKSRAPSTGKAVLAACALVVVLPLVFAVILVTSRPRSKPASSPGTTATSDASVFAAYGRSPSCKSCHEEAFKSWEHSHHALAERPIEPALDASAFEPPHGVVHGTQHSEARITNGQFQLVTQGLGQTNRPFEVARVIGVNPLLQYLIPVGDGRVQASELCFDPKRMEWFNVYGTEDRQPGEWGHWTGRGMNWNNMCATCHNTRLRKNYDARTDSYRTTMAEQGVSCEACHGPMADHNAWQAKHPNQSGDPTIRKLSKQQMFHTCAQCHARRAELTGNFRPGESFFDHHALTIPDETDLFYPDGQVREEDYEFTAFLGSKMHAAGVRCMDCHEPHTSKLRVPGNLMCMACHGNTLTNGAPRIDLETHSRHKVGTSGDFCTDCHMPTTFYMQRHPRHDHGFTIPDPRLTKELGIPNACNRCHTNQTADWSLEAMNKWYGPRTNEQMRARATAIAQARSGNAAAVPALVKMTSTESNFFWRAVAANLLRSWAGENSVRDTLVKSTQDTNELVRAMAVRGLEPYASVAGTPAAGALAKGLVDPARNVRIDAAWALRRTVNTNSTAGRDLLANLSHNVDQPSGAMQLGVFELERGNVASAIEHLQRAVSWDTNSAPLYDTLAVALSIQGRSVEALVALRTACHLAPRDAAFRYRLGLVLNEVGRLDEARVALEQAVKLDPQFAQAWYNLGLAYAAQKKPEAALEALVRAESLDATSAQIPYARATILAQLGRTDEARRAAQRALELQPGHSEAQELLRGLNQ
ncbi:MAG: tetratricopeptide repeat protein [Verrucomicrobiota bacterium]